MATLLDGGMVIVAEVAEPTPSLLDLSRDLDRAMRALRAAKQGRRQTARAIAARKPSTVDSYPPRG